MGQGGGLSSIAALLEQRRSKMFVGRKDELAAVARLLDPGDGLRFLYVMGPGGIGKTEILHAAARRATADGHAVTWLDGFEQAWTADDLTAAVLRATATPGSLLVLDVFDGIAHLENAWRTECAPRLPSHARVLAGGRVRLGSAWREDPGWGGLSEVVVVPPLDLDESEQLLHRRGVDRARVRGDAAELPGHPLTLALFAEVVTRDPDAVPRLDRHGPLTRVLVDRLLAGLSPRAREGLEAASLIRVLTQELLEHMLGVADARVEFDELTRWSFVDCVPPGLQVHDVVRAAVAADFAWRAPRRAALLLNRAATHHLAAWPEDRSTDAGRLVPLAWHLLSHSLEQLLERQRDDLHLIPMWSEAWPEIVAMVERHEGPESLAALQHWREAGAEIFVCTSGAGEVLGFQSVLSLDRTTEVEAARDPGTLPLWRLWRDAGVLGAGRARLMRHWMAADTYQAVSPVQSEFFFQITEFMGAPDTSGLAQAFADVAFYRQFVNEFSPQYLPETDFVCDGHSYGCVSAMFLEKSSAQMLRGYLGAAAARWAQQAAEAPLPDGTGLDRAGFERAVLAALRTCDRPDLLASCALAGSRWAARSLDRGADAIRTGHALRDLLRQASSRVFSSERDAILAHVVERTYFCPGPKQRAIAADLGLSYGTYRRHLASATRHLVAALWALENEGGA